MLRLPYTTVTECRICSSEDLHDVLDLGSQPIPNGFLTKSQLHHKEERYPLAVVFCNNCTLMQLKYLVDPEVMFKNYLYIPSASRTRMEHFKGLANEVSEAAKLDNNSLVIDVGSNDGSLLIAFKNLGYKVLGIDPAENLVTVASLSGIDTELGYFNAKFAKKITEKHGKAKAMTATNVIAHIQNVHEVLKGAEILLEREGVFMMQFPYSLDLLEKNLFDTIYHEHLSYFSVKSLKFLEEKSDMEMFDVKKSDLDGGSIKVFWKKKINKKIEINSKKIEIILEEEINYGLDKKETYLNFAKRVEKLRDKTRKKLQALRRANKTIIGYGAAAKANVTLNYFDLGTSIFEYIVDSTPYKQGLFTPGTHIPIYSEDKIYETNPDYIVIFAWNFSDEIMNKNRKFKNSGGKFIILEPDFEII